MVTRLNQIDNRVFAASALALLLGGCGAPPLEGEAEEGATPVTSVAAPLQHEGRRCRRPPADVPAALQVPADECLAVQALGTGVQIYTCSAGVWAAKAPEANLTDNHGRFVGNHFLGPSWQWRDGSKVKGMKVAQVAAPDPTADIPWLLLAVASEDGEGKLQDAKHIQRLHTAGGLAPAGACTDGAEARVPYTSDYLFYHPRASEE